MQPADIIFIVLSVLVIMGAYLVKQKTFYIICQTAGNLVLMVNYIYVSDVSSAVTVGIATVRFVVFFLLVNKYDDIPWSMIILFTAAVGIAGCVTAKNPIDLLMVAAVMLYSACYKIRDLMTLKMALFLPLAMMFVNALIKTAYTGIICQGFELVLILIQTIIFFWKKRGKKEHSTQAIQENGEQSINKNEE